MAQDNFVPLMQYQEYEPEEMLRRATEMHTELTGDGLPGCGCRSA